MMARKLIVLMAGLVFFFLPWYYTESGLPQPVDAFILILLTFFFFMRFPYLNIYLKNSKALHVFFLFSIYICVILLVNFIINNQEVTFFLSVQNLYSVVLVITFLAMIVYLQKQYTFKAYYSLIRLFLLIDAIIPLIFAFKNGITVTRISLSFNNPNQLGFYALVNMAIFFYLSLIARQEGILGKKLISLLIININLYFVFLSASRACYPIVLMYVLSYPLIFRLKLKGFAVPLFWVMGGLLSLGGILFLSYKLYLLTMQTRSIHYVSIAADLYFRALHGITYNFNSIWYLLFGNGTYNTDGRTLEFHNNFFAIFNMVGLFGLILYVYLNIVIVKALLKKGFYYFVPYFCYLFYSMLHYSYRTRVNWIFLALIIFIIKDINRDKTIRYTVKDEL